MKNLKKLIIAVPIVALVLGGISFGLAQNKAESKSSGYNCQLNFETQISTCQPGDPISPYLPRGGINWAKSQAVMEIDMTGWNELKVKIWFEDLAGKWILNIGNSYSNNGAGGDAAHFSNDSELDIMGPAAPWQELRVFGNDYSTGVIPRPVLRIPEFLDKTEDKMDLKIKDGYLWIKERERKNQATVQNDYVFRLGQPDAECDCIDNNIYAGFNRTIGSWWRQGKGVVKVIFELK